MTLPVMKNYINGEWESSESNTMGDVWCPATGEKIAEVPYSTAAEVDRDGPDRIVDLDPIEEDHREDHEHAGHGADD